MSFLHTQTNLSTTLTMRELMKLSGSNGRMLNDRMNVGKQCV
jgi:hypothetical protein